MAKKVVNGLLGSQIVELFGQWGRRLSLAPVDFDAEFQLEELTGFVDQNAGVHRVERGRLGGCSATFERYRILEEHFDVGRRGSRQRNSVGHAGVVQETRRVGLHRRQPHQIAEFQLDAEKQSRLEVFQEDIESVPAQTLAEDGDHTCNFGTIRHGII